jgi:Zn finger protein HypA/HybF involved in hydrogenase expression
MEKRYHVYPPLSKIEKTGLICYFITMERTVSAIFSFIVFFVGLAFVLAKPFSASRLLIGVVLMAVSLAVLYLAFRRKESVIVEQKIDLGGTVNPKLLKCRNCGAELSRNDITVRAGVVFTSCPYCHSEYQIEEEPKW